MRILAAFGTLLLFLVGGAALAADGPVFVLDIDGTLVESSFPKGAVYPQKEMVDLTLDGQLLRHRVVPGAPELVESLSRIPGARIYFFSGGTEDRNLALLAKLKTPGGKSFLDVAAGTFHRSNLTMLPRRNWGVKDVRGLIPDLDPGKTFFLDDIPEFMADGFERNLIPIAGHDNLGSEARELARLRGQGSEAAARYFRQRNQLIWARGVIDRALADAQARGVSPVEALEKLRLQRDSSALYEAGLAKLREVSPGLDLIEVPGARIAAARPAPEPAGAGPPGLGCYGAFKSLLRHAAGAHL